jgi:hypothetical protein
MTRRPPALLLLTLALAGCSAPGGPFPSLQPRTAEAIDPRLPVDRPMNARPVDAALAATLDRLVAQARAGDAAFGPAMAEAERLAANAGAARSEGWIAAQEALTAAIAARRPTATALGDIDNLAGGRLETQGGMAPTDFAAVNSAAAAVSEIDQRQAARIKAVQTRLGS